MLPRIRQSSTLGKCLFLLCLFFYGTSLKESRAQDNSKQFQSQDRTKETPQQEEAQYRQDKKEESLSKNSDAEKSPLKELDQSIAYPDGLYSGTLRIRFQGARKENQKYSFRLYIKEKKRLYYFFDNASRLVYKLLYFQYPQSDLMVLAWDPLRELLHRKEREARFYRVLQSGFSYWDLSMLPYSSFYRLVAKSRPKEFEKEALGLEKEEKLQKESFYAQSKNLPRQEKFRGEEKFPEDLDPSSQALVSYILKANVLSPYVKMKARIQKKQKRIARLDFYTPPSLLKKSLYPSYIRPIYDQSQKKESSLNKAATSFYSLDFERKTLSILELKSYNPRAALKAGLFDPRFIRN